MPGCDIIVVGGSAGAVPVMEELARSFPADLPAAVFMVLHVSADFTSMLPEILARSGPLPVKHPEDREPVQRGHIYVAPPDRHLTLEDGVVRVMRGPRENRHRPAIDPLFRTAARVYDSRVIGVILSGWLDDGAAGLRAVRSCGGIAIVQDPASASAAQMPESALKYGGADYVLPGAQIGHRLIDLVKHCGRRAVSENKSCTTGTNYKSMQNLEASRPDDGDGKPSTFACPDCSGVLWELKDGELVRFRCRVGHAYTMANLAEEQVHHAENALWAAMRALEEKAALATRIADSASDSRMVQRLHEQAEADRDHAETIRKMLFIENDERPARFAD